MPLVPFHGWLADGYKSMPIPAVAVFSAILSKVAAYGFLRIVLPLFPYASQHFQTLMLVIALVSILWATALAFTHPRRAAGGRLLERRAARLHHARDLLAAPRGRPGRAAADGQPRARHRAAVLHRRRAGRARRRLGEAARHGRARVPRAGARGAVPDRRARHAGDARLLELRRRVPDPARRVQVQARDRGDRVRRRRRRRRLRAAAVHHARCTTASGRRVDSREIGARRRARARPARARDPRARASTRSSLLQARSEPTRRRRDRRPDSPSIDGGVSDDRARSPPPTTQGPAHRLGGALAVRRARRRRAGRAARRPAPRALRARAGRPGPDARRARRDARARRSGAWTTTPSIVPARWRSTTWR